MNPESGAKVSTAITYIVLFGGFFLTVVALTKWSEKNWIKIIAIIFSIIALFGFYSSNYFNSKIDEKRETIINNSAKGITVKYDPDCTKREQRGPGIVKATINNSGVVKLAELMEAEKYSETIEKANKVRSQMPKCPTPYYYLGLAYSKTGKMSKARKSCKNFIAMTSGDADFDKMAKGCKQTLQ